LDSKNSFTEISIEEFKGVFWKYLHDYFKNLKENIDPVSAFSEINSYITGLYFI
jgi:hypothetical protein